MNKEVFKILNNKIKETEKKIIDLSKHMEVTQSIIDDHNEKPTSNLEFEDWKDEVCHGSVLYKKQELEHEELESDFKKLYGLVKMANDWPRQRKKTMINRIDELEIEIECLEERNKYLEEENKELKKENIALMNPDPVRQNNKKKLK